ncbi:hypothetical protein [Fischerella sp. JS2]|uniref:hypothetical protein n=1 Tax=Fischerella sp. JS2 TaxID=2597771 RepID=UPI0028E4C2C6|nr:hypothetical protein [Fischerella sp. JS2]
MEKLEQNAIAKKLKSQQQTNIVVKLITINSITLLNQYFLYLELALTFGFTKQFISLQEVQVCD